LIYNVCGNISDLSLIIEFVVISDLTKITYDPAKRISKLTKSVNDSTYK